MRISTGDMVTINDPNSLLGHLNLFEGGVYTVERVRRLKYHKKDVYYAKLRGCENLIWCGRLVLVQSKDHFETEGIFEI